MDGRILDGYLDPKRILPKCLHFTSWPVFSQVSMKLIRQYEEGNKQHLLWLCWQENLLLQLETKRKMTVFDEGLPFISAPSAAPSFIMIHRYDKTRQFLCGLINIIFPVLLSHDISWGKCYGSHCWWDTPSGHLTLWIKALSAHNYVNFSCSLCIT